VIESETRRQVPAAEAAQQLTDWLAPAVASPCVSQPHRTYHPDA